MRIRLTAWATFLLMCSGCTGRFQAVQSAGLVQQSSIFGSISAQGTFADGNGSHTWSAKQMTQVACSGVFQFTADASTGVVKVFADGSGNFTGLMSLPGENDKAISGTCANGTITMNSPGQQYTGTYNGSGQVTLGGSFVSFSWQSGRWSSCSLACGGGTQTRAVTCTSSNGASTTVVDNSFCSSQAAPGNQTACNPQSCTEACSVTNGSGTQTWANGAYGACQITSCNSGFDLQNGACVANVCSPNAQQSCQAGNGTGSQTCSSSGSAWGACGNLTSCNSGFNLQNGACVANICTPNVQQICQISNGTGSQMCNSSGSAWGACGNLTSCNSGYTLNGGACVPTPPPTFCTPNAQQSCQSGNGTGSQTCTSSGSAWGACGNLTSCNSGYNLQNGVCVAINNPFGPFSLSASQQIVWGDLVLAMQTDGNLVLYRNGSPVWSTGTAGRLSCSLVPNNCLASFQSDGNLVLYDTGMPYWNSGSAGHPGSYLVFSDSAPFISIRNGNTIFWPMTKQIWFVGLPYTNSDFWNLFQPTAVWQTVASKTSVVTIGSAQINSASDAQLQQLFFYLKQHGIRLGVGPGALSPTSTCGSNVEGFEGPAWPSLANRIKSLGGTIDVIGFDEPYYYGHTYDGPQACHWSNAQIAQALDQFMTTMRSIFPNAEFWDTEPNFTGTNTDTRANEAWLDAFEQTTGYPMPGFMVEFDDGSGNAEKEMPDLLEIQNYAKQRGTRFGVLYDSPTSGQSPAQWYAEARQNVITYEQQYGGNPDVVVFLSWVDQPSQALPETTPYTLTYLIYMYLTNGW